MNLKNLRANPSVDLSEEIETLKSTIKKLGRRDIWEYGTMGPCSSCKTSTASNDTRLYQ